MKHLKLIIAAATLTLCLWSLVTALLQALLIIGTMTITGLALIQILFYTFSKSRKATH